MTDKMVTTKCPKCKQTVYWQFVKGEPAVESTGVPDMWQGYCEGCGADGWMNEHPHDNRIGAGLALLPSTQHEKYLKECLGF
jgi:SH3-like domain-containing protein